MAENTLDISVISQEVRMGAPDTSIISVGITNNTNSPVSQVFFLLVPLDFVDADHVSKIKFGPASLEASDPLANPPSGMTKFQLGATRGVSIAPGDSPAITLDISNIPAAAVGAYELQLLWGTRGQELNTTKLEINVLGADDVPKIVSFKAKASVITLTGKPPVELSWETSPDSDVSLFRMSQKVLPTGGEVSAPTKMKDFQDKGYDTAGLYPYRLQVKAKGKTISRTIFVRIQAPGWNLIECDQGVPLNILSDGGNKLYGIFNSFRGSAIYPLDPAAGSMGAQNEICRKGHVPDNMQKSPAAFFDNKIFLVGGSQVDASVFSNEVHAYDPMAQPQDDPWTNLSEAVSWSPRMGHAITSFKGRLWVTGGVDENGNTCKDAFYTEDGKIWKAAGELPARMCFHAMHGFSGVVDQGRADYLWLYGGQISPLGKPLTSMSYAEPDGPWKQIQFYNSSNQHSENPGFGAPFGAALTTAYDTNQKQEVLRVVATYQPENASMTSGMYTLKLPDPANLNLSGSRPDDFVWPTSAPDTTVQPFKLCATTHKNYIFIHSILSGLANDTLTFHVT